MKMIYFASVCGATLLTVTSFANAQGTGVGSSSDQGVTSKQCWDVSSNIIREKNPTSASVPSDKTPKTTVGSAVSGAAGSGASGSTSSTGNVSARPAGMPDC